MTAYVYFLVEKDHFKIGKSINVAMRSRQVTPDLIPEKSWAIAFDKDYDAVRCEKSLHWMFRSHRLSKMNRDGGTEFFDIECLDKVIDFIRASKKLFLYSRVVNGEEFDKEKDNEVIQDYGQWSLVHLPSGRWSVVWSVSLEIEDLSEAIVNEDHEFFNIGINWSQPPSYTTKEDALKKIIKEIERMTQSDRINLEDYNKPYLKKACKELNVLTRWTNES